MRDERKHSCFYFYVCAQTGARFVAQQSTGMLLRLSAYQAVGATLWGCLAVFPVASHSERISFDRDGDTVRSQVTKERKHNVQETHPLTLLAHTHS